MAMISSFLATLSTIQAVFITLLVHLLSPTSCLNHNSHPPNNIQGSMVEEKTRLGSTPPSCYNKCNNCHPCMAVQVPTMPSHNQLQPSHSTTAASTATTMDNYIDSSPYSSGNNNRYSNYKPLGWKCRCGGHFYNP